MSKKNYRTLHIICLVLALGLCFCFLLALKDADNYITMPLIKSQQKSDEMFENATKVDEKIAAIAFPITSDEKEKIALIREEYEQLDEQAKAKVTLLKLLEEAERQTEVLKDKETAKKVTDMINSITDNFDLYTLEKVRAEYENLTEQQKSYVTNLFILENAEEEIKTVVTKDNLKIGDTVIFCGGNIYYSSRSSYVANIKGYSLCKITNVSRDSTHPYHLVSVDGGGVYGWVDIESMAKE